MIQVRVAYHEKMASRCRKCLKRNGVQTPIISTSLWEECGGHDEARSCGFVGTWCLDCYEEVRQKVKEQLKMPSITRMTLQNRYCEEPKMVARTEAHPYQVKEWLEGVLDKS